MMVFLLYLDVCCLNRPFDDQSQDRIRLEAEAVLSILNRIESGEWSWAGSEVVELEIDRTPDPDRRHKVRLLTTMIGRTNSVGEAEVERATQLESLGFRSFDALHLACAESGAVDVLLTTDDRMLRLSARVSANLRVRVENPLKWVQEVIV